MAYEDDIAAAAAEADEQRHRIVDTRPGRDGETYIPDTTNARQDPSPRPVPERDSSGQPWRITADGRHIGTHNGDDYCLEWLPIPERREPVATKPAEPQPAADEPSPAGRERERDEK